MVPAASVANELSPGAGKDFSFALAPGAYLDCFHINDRSPIRAVDLRIILNQGLALFATISLPECSGYFLRVFVFELNDEFPLSKQINRGHSCILYSLDK